MSGRPSISTSEITMFPSPISPLVSRDYRTLAGTIVAVAFFPDGKRIVVVGKTTCVWNLENDEQEGDPFQGNSSRTVAVAVSQLDGTDLVATGGEYDRVCLWKANERTTPYILWVVPVPPVSKDSSPVDPPPQSIFRINSVAFSKSRKLLASGGSEGVVRIWKVNVKDGDYPTLHSKIVFPQSNISTLQFCPSPDNSNHLAMAFSDEKAISVVNASTGQKVYELAGHTIQISRFEWFNGGQHLVSAGESIRIWNALARAQSGEPISGHAGRVNYVSVSSDGKYIASCSNDDTVRVWSFAKREQIGTAIQVPKVHIVQFSLDSKSLLTVSRSEGIKIWPMEQLEVEEELKRTKEGVKEIIAASQEFNDNLNTQLRHGFNGLRARHDESILLSTDIQQTATANKERLDNLDESLYNLSEQVSEKVSSLADQQQDSVQTLQSDLARISEDVRELKAEIYARQNRIQEELLDMKTEMQRMFGDLTSTLKNAMSKGGKTATN